ncbi:DUF2344 domain-containing protein, partial [Klebsiella pneumoniae]|uniref:DUF2344 domain-containing protein n=1 Tax=Klebsiella pneumoniae TaxID=573 RepID=UPI002731F00B
TASVDTGLFVPLLAAQLPAGVEITGAVRVDQNHPPLPSLVEAASYRAGMINEGPGHINSKLLKQALGDLLSSNEIMILK